MNRSSNLKIEFFLIVTLFLVYMFVEEFRYFLYVYIFLLLTTYQIWPIKNKSFKQSILHDSQYLYYLVCEKEPFSNGHAFVVLVDNSNGGSEVMAFAHYPFSRYRLNYEHELEVFKNLLENTSNHTTFHCWEIDKTTYDNFHQIFKSYIGNFTIYTISQLVPLPYNCTNVFCNCSTFAASITNRTLGTNFKGSTPLKLAKQIENLE
ncbi:MAG: hypothetical protein ACRCXZ_10205 [Patescibacteria group bacterium]